MKEETMYPFGRIALEERMPVYLARFGMSREDRVSVMK